MAGPEKKTEKAPESTAEGAPLQPNPWLATVLGLAASLILFVSTLWVVTQYLKHRPLDLLTSTHDVGIVASDVLHHQGLSPESIEASKPQLEREARAHYYRTTVDAHLPDTLDPERVMNALERAFWREQIVIGTEDVAESERSAVLRFEGFDVGEIRLHHAPARHEEKAVPDAQADESAHPTPNVSPAPELAAAQNLPAKLTLPGQWTPAFGPAVSGGRPQIAQALARIAIIVDDGGYGGEPTEIILALDPALTLAILPNTPQGTSLADAAKQRGFEVILHMPMENTSPTLVHPGQLDGGMDAAEIRRLTESSLSQVPGAVGINNHQGSKFTTNAKALGHFMEGIEDAGLFFIDSRTSPESVAFEVARQFGIPTAACSLFLDNDSDPAAIRAQIDQLISQAKAQGNAIGICHFRQSTAEVLREILPKLSGEGVQLVHASELVR